MKLFKKIIAATFVFLPFISFAQYDVDIDSIIDSDIDDALGISDGGGLWNLFYIMQDILNQVAILLIGLAVVFFLYGIVKYMGSTDDEENRIKSKNIMIYGIIGFFVMISFWGIVNILVNTFELDTAPYVQPPYFDGNGTSGDGGVFDY